MADSIYTTHVAAEVIETRDTPTGGFRITSTSFEVIEAAPADNRFITSQVAVEVILSRQDMLKRFIGWGVPIKSDIAS